MIEIVFGESAGGGLKIAQQNGMGGKPDDVFTFDLAFSIGGIIDDSIQARHAVLNLLFSVYPKNIGEAAAADIVKNAELGLKTALARAEKGEDIRIWYSDNPDEACGLYWFMARLNSVRDSLGDVYLMKLPAWESDGVDHLTRYTSWGDIEPETWHKYTDLQVKVPAVFIRACAAAWLQLQIENAPLRAVLNGRIMSVPETVYDDFIIREIDRYDGPFREAIVIGNVLGRYQLGISDAFIALRIEEMIKAGWLEVLTEADDDTPKYHRMLKKA